jgi:hypothetical protein
MEGPPSFVSDWHPPCCQQVLPFTNVLFPEPPLYVTPIGFSGECKWRALTPRISSGAGKSVEDFVAILLTWLILYVHANQ